MEDMTFRLWYHQQQQRCIFIIYQKVSEYAVVYILILKIYTYIQEISNQNKSGTPCVFKTLFYLLLAVWLQTTKLIHVKFQFPYLETKIRVRLEENNMIPWKLLSKLNMVFGPEYILNISLLLLLPLLFSLLPPTLLFFLLFKNSVTNKMRPQAN